MSVKEKTVIELRNVWKTYKMGKVEVNALRGINIKINKGEFVSIVGPSGSGKSTAMSLVGCLDTPSKGKIFLEHQDIGELGESELAQIRGQKIGFVFQKFNLMYTMSAMKNVVLPMIFQNKEIDREARGAKLLSMVKLDHRMHHKPSEMSGGEMQRVAIARSLANDPEIILADEPTGNLDSKTGEEIIKIILDLHKIHKKTIVMVTHDKELAKLAQRTIHLKDGQVLKETKNRK